MLARIMGKSRPRVYVTRTLPGAALETLRARADADVWQGEEPPPRAELASALQTADGLVCLLTDVIDAELLADAPRLRVVSTMAVGYDNIDVDAATRLGVAVANTPGVLTETTADFAFALLLSAARRLPEGERTVREGLWTTWSPAFLLGRDIHGATLGIVGLGAIGRAVARRARGFGMDVLYHSRGRNAEAEEELGCRPADFDALLSSSDFVSVHLPLTPETRHMFDDDAFARMKPTAIFVNTARGPVVDEAALLRALATKRIAGAAIDVAEVEPMAKFDPLLRLPNLLVTPHIASASVATRSRMAEMAVEHALQAMAGERPSHCVNTQVFDA